MARLIDKETAINDLVSANKRGGMRLVNEFENARKQDVEVYQSNVNEYKQKMTTMIKEELASLKFSFSMERFRVANLEKDWENQQRTMWANVNAALATATITSVN